MFGLFFWFYNAECLSVYNCILKVFSSDGFLLFIYIICCRCSRLSPLTCCVSCSSPTPFYSCFVQLALRAQTQNMSGSVLLTTEASQLSVGIAEVAYYIENPKTTSKRIIFMELFDILEMLRKLAILCK